MNTTSKPGTAQARVFTLGQQFRSLDLDGQGRPTELTLTRIARDRLGLTHITLMRPDGREISAFAEQVAAAISERHLSTVIDTMPVAV